MILEKPFLPGISQYLSKNSQGKYIEESECGKPISQKVYLKKLKNSQWHRSDLKIVNV